MVTGTAEEKRETGEGGREGGRDREIGKEAERARERNRQRKRWELGRALLKGT